MWEPTGLIGWVPNCDTLHTLIRDYRDSRKVPLNVEHRLMLGMAPDYDQLSVIQKVEVFEHALDSTSGAPSLVCTLKPLVRRLRAPTAVADMLDTEFKIDKGAYLGQNCFAIPGPESLPIVRWEQKGWRVLTASTCCSLGKPEEYVGWVA